MGTAQDRDTGETPAKHDVQIRPCSAGPSAAERVTHTIDPIFDERSRVLVLGTMPSPRSREVGFYYGHPQNRFWRVMERMYGLEDQSLVDNDGRRAFLLASGIALWDVLASCEIAGASDASIVDPVPNDLARILDIAPHPDRLHNRREGQPAVPQISRGPAQDAPHRARGAPLHQPGQRAHAPGRSGCGLPSRRSPRPRGNRAPRVRHRRDT